MEQCELNGHWYLGLYEKSGVLAREFVKRGYKAMCVDLDAEPGERDGVTYVKSNMMDFIPPRYVIEEGVAFVAAFPPCDHLAVSGARWFAGKGLGALAQSVELFGKAAFWAEYFDAPYMIENPVSTISTYWRKPDHIFHPWQFSGLNADDCYTKKTCLWTGNGFVMPELDHPADVVPDDRIHKAAPGPERASFRSRTPQGFSIAVAASNCC